MGPRTKFDIYVPRYFRSAKGTGTIPRQLPNLDVQLAAASGIRFQRKTRMNDERVSNDLRLADFLGIG
jgi:hypothetical protein